MKIKCRFFITILLLAYFTTGTCAFGATNDILSTYESDLTIMTVDATSGESEFEAGANLDEEEAGTNQNGEIGRAHV